MDGWMNELVLGGCVCGCADWNSDLYRSLIGWMNRWIHVDSLSPTGSAHTRR